MLLLAIALYPSVSKDLEARAPRRSQHWALALPMSWPSNLHVVPSTMRGPKWNLEKQDPALPHRVYCVRCPFITQEHQEAQLRMETWELPHLLSLFHTHSEACGSSSPR